MAEDLKDQLALSVEWERLKRIAQKARLAAYDALVDADNAEEALAEFEKANGLEDR